MFAHSDKIIVHFSLQLEHYQEQPQLIDKFLSNIITNVMDLAQQWFDSERKKCHGCFKIIYFLCKMRGYKIVGMQILNIFVAKP